jgi:tRNA(Arg) A34 adenosine deaminase TadA
MDSFLVSAIEEAKAGLAEGGIPIGSVLAYNNKIIGRGHNRRIQKGSTILHAEIDSVERVHISLKRAHFIQHYLPAACVPELSYSTKYLMLLSVKTLI